MNSKQARELLEAYKSVYISVDESTKEEVENIEELHTGKHGQTEKQYQDGRSDAGKMVSGDSKMSGSKYAQGRRTGSDAGPQTAGGSQKPASQGKMDSGSRTDLTFRKAALKKKADDMKKEEVVNEEGADSLKDRRMERGGVDGNNRYNNAPGKPNTLGKKKPSGMSSFDKVVGDLKSKYGDKAIMAKKTVKSEDTDICSHTKKGKDCPVHGQDLCPEKSMEEAVYGGTPAKKEAPKDDRMMVTTADRKGNTKAYQNYKAGMKSKITGKSMYKAGPGVDEEVDIFDKVTEFLYVEGYAETIEEAQWVMVNILDEELVEEIASNY
jgi:hypothetical protein